jgi:hypothetical protein
MNSLGGSEDDIICIGDENLDAEGDSELAPESSSDDNSSDE